MAVITAIFAFILIYVFDSKPASRVRIEQLPAGRLPECADIYRSVLEAQGCRILHEHTSIHKGRIEFVYHHPRRTTRDGLHAALSGVPEDLRGDIDWEFK